MWTDILVTWYIINQHWVWRQCIKIQQNSFTVLIHAPYPSLRIPAVLLNDTEHFPILHHFGLSLGIHGVMELHPQLQGTERKLHIFHVNINHMINSSEKKNCNTQAALRTCNHQRAAATIKCLNLISKYCINGWMEDWENIWCYVCL